jgi:uncharacterized protein (TIGR03435 family)
MDKTTVKWRIRVGIDLRHILAPGAVLNGMKLLLCFCLSLPAICQPAFTVASMKQNEFLPGKRPIVIVNPGRITLTGLTLQTLIARAYMVKEYQVRGPAWMYSTRYNIAATMPEDTPETVVWEMLQALLAERLRLTVRRTRQELPVYAIVRAKSGPKLKPVSPGEPGVQLRGGLLNARSATMQSLANLLGTFLDRPVVDQTGLDGAYEVTLSFTPDPNLGPAMKKLSVEMELTNTEANGGSIFTAVQEQLGLKLEARKAAVEILVVESALKVPVEN